MAATSCGCATTPTRPAAQRRVDGDGNDLALSIGDAADQPAASLALDGLAGQIVAHARDLGLDPLRGFDEAFQIRKRHQVLISFSEAPKRFCAFLIMGCW